jgi:hypothetical protein
MGDDQQWWVDPLAYRLCEAVEEWKWRGDHVGAVLMQVLAAGGPKLRTSLAQLFAVNREGEFFSPASDFADTLWSSPFQIVGAPASTVRKSDVLRVGVLADLTPERLRQVNGVALVLVRAANAFQDPPRLVIDTSDDLGRAGDPVKIRRLSAPRASERRVSYRRMLRHKGAVVDTIREFKKVFGREHYATAATLIEILTGWRLTARELRTLAKR